MIQKPCEIVKTWWLLYFLEGKNWISRLRHEDFNYVQVSSHHHVQLIWRNDKFVHPLNPSQLRLLILFLFLFFCLFSFDLLSYVMDAPIFHSVGIDGKKKRKEKEKRAYYSIRLIIHEHFTEKKDLITQLLNTQERRKQ